MEHIEGKLLIDLHGKFVYIDWPPKEEVKEVFNNENPSKKDRKRIKKDPEVTGEG